VREMLRINKGICAHNLPPQEKSSAETIDLFLAIHISIHSKANTDLNISGTCLLVIIFCSNDRCIFLV
jgi:hypothetical protein